MTVLNNNNSKNINLKSLIHWQNTAKNAVFCIIVLLINLCMMCTSQASEVIIRLKGLALNRLINHLNINSDSKKNIRKKNIF